MTATNSVYRPAETAGRDGFVQLLHAEWTKFTTVRAWVLGMVAAAVVMVLIGLLGTGATNRGQDSDPSFPVGPGGQAVNDNFYFVHQPLPGDGSVTVAVTSLTGVISAEQDTPGIQPWAKAGLIVKAGLGQGSSYAAIMVTGAHGVRMQHNYTEDVAGLPGAVTASAPRWLRLVRTGDVITGYNSVDGSAWTRVGAARLTGLPSTAEIGMFTTSPQAMTEARIGAAFNPAVATGVFGPITLSGGWTEGQWKGEKVGSDAGHSGSYSQTLDGGFTRAGATFTITGAGDISPIVGGTGPGYTIDNFLVGGFAGLIVMIVLGTVFITTEYRSGLIRTTLMASPRRARVLAAKAIVLGSVSLTTGLVAGFVAILIGRPRARAHGFGVVEVPTATELRVVIGTALLLAVATVLALAVGALLKRSAAAAAIVIAAMILPYLLALSAVLPLEPSQWLLRVTPAAGFAIQQSLERYDQVITTYTPAAGYYPLPPWVGFAVLCAYTGAALGAAMILLRRRDA